MDKAGFLQAARAGRAEWEALLAEVGPARMNTPNVVGFWSVKDVIAHIYTWERWATVNLESETTGEMPDLAEMFGRDMPAEVDDMNGDQFNEWLVAQFSDLLLDALTTKEGRVFARFLTAAQNTPEYRLLETPDSFGGFANDAGQAIWQILAGQTYEHYALHAADIRGWLGKT